MLLTIINKKPIVITLFFYIIMFTMSSNISGNTIFLLSANASSVETVTKSADVNEIDQYVLDAIITSKVKAAFLRDPRLKSLEIQVKTNNFQVRLSGTVDTTAERDHAVYLALDIKQVVAVINDIQVR